MKNKNIIILICILLLLFIIIYISINNHNFIDNNKIPTQVIDKYKELKEIYKDSLGASIFHCVSNKDEIYAASGSGGFTGVSYYFSANGTELGFLSISDVIDSNDPPPVPPIDFSEYECSEIIKSKSIDK